MWEISSTGQLISVFSSIVLGAILCVFYDFLRAMRKAGSNSFLAVTAGDIFFFVLSAFCFFLLSLARTDGEIRGYMLLSTLLGFILCRITLSKAVFFIFTTLLKFLFKTGKFISLKIMLICEKIYSFTEHLIIKLKNVIIYIKKCLKKAGKVLYNKKNLSKGRKKMR